MTTKSTRISITVPETLKEAMSMTTKQQRIRIQEMEGYCALYDGDIPIAVVRKSIDAKLFAAAPELLEALEFIVKDYGSEQAFAMTKAAILKATT